MKKRADSIYPRRKWSEEDMIFLREHYSSMSMPGLMDHLTRTDLAIHKRAGLLGLAGNRYSVNNYANGASYNNVNGVKPRPPKAKKAKATAFPKISATPPKERPKRQRWCDSKLETKPFNSEGKVLVRIDHRTSIYVPEAATQTEIETIIKRFKKVS